MNSNKYLPTNSIYYPVSLHLQDVYESLGYKTDDFTKSEQAQNEVLSLPMYPELTGNQITEIVNALDKNK